jgi:hypothetical protein
VSLKGRTGELIALRSSLSLDQIFIM